MWGPASVPPVVASPTPQKPDPLPPPLRGSRGGSADVAARAVAKGRRSLCPLARMNTDSMINTTSVFDYPRRDGKLCWMGQLPEGAAPAPGRLAAPNDSRRRARAAANEIARGSWALGPALTLRGRSGVTATSRTALSFLRPPSAHPSQSVTPLPTPHFSSSLRGTPVCVYILGILKLHGCLSRTGNIPELPPCGEVTSAGPLRISVTVSFVGLVCGSGGNGHQAQLVLN